MAHCVMLNARSLRNKIADLHECIDRLKPQFFFISETWFSSDITDAMIVPNDMYHVVRTDREGRCGGGVCALINKMYNIIPVPTVDNVEIVAFDVVCATSKFRFVVCYRPPYYDSAALNYLTAFIACLELLCNINYTVFIVGDFNMPDVCWSDFSFTGSHANFSNIMLDFVCDHGLSQCVVEPTRGNNLLDLVFTNDPLLVNDCNVDAAFIGCDHMSVHFNIVLPVELSPNICLPLCDDPESEVLCFYNFNAGDYDGLNMYLSSVNWQEVFGDISDINECWNSFTDILNKGIELFVPVKVFDPTVPRNERKLLPLFIRQLYRKKNAAWRLYKRFKTDVLLAKYKTACVKCKNAYEQFVLSKENALIENGNLGSFYRYVNSKLVFKSGIGVLKDDDGAFIYDDQAKAKLLNDFYSSVFVSDNNILPVFAPRVPNDCELSSVTFTPDVVYKHLSKLNPKSGGGPDGLSAVLLKNVAGSLAQPLSLLYSASFELSAIPDMWKAAIVTPVFKKGSPTAASNYRPISLTCIVCKIMETIIKDRLIDYLLDKKLITNQQHGFLAKHSTCSQLLECVNDWTIELNLRHSIDVAYIDFQKAFDSVVGSKLGHKLSSYGISGSLLNWLSAFLSNRVQAVKVNNKVSEYIPVRSGVPQGSVLGPVLFLLYVNDLVDLFGPGLTAKLFADDVKIYAVITDVNDTVAFQAGLDALNAWSVDWQLPISVNKCSVLHLGRKNIDHTYQLNGVSLPDVKEVTDLGIKVDSNLRFVKHYRFISNKAQQRASLILRTFRSRDPILLFKAFSVYVRPLLEYCSPVWAPVYVTDVELIERVQRRFTKRLNGLWHLCYFERLRMLGNIETLELRRLKSDLTMVYKIVHKLIAIDFNEFFALNNFSCTRGHNFKLTKPKCNNNARQFSFACRCINAWNFLPVDVVAAASLKKFKAGLSTVDFIKFLKYTV